MTEKTERGEEQENFDKLLDKYPDGFHFKETSQADDVVELYYGNEFVEKFSAHGIDPERLDGIIRNFLKKKGPKVS